MKTSQRTWGVVVIAAALYLLVAASVLAAPSAPNAVTISKTVSPQLIKPDYAGVLTYTIVLANDTGVASGLVMTDVLPTLLSFGTWVTQPAGAVNVGDTVRWTGALTAGSPVTLTFTALLPGPESMTVLVNNGQIVNTAYVGHLEDTVIIIDDSDTAITRFYRYIYLPLVMRNAQ